MSRWPGVTHVGGFLVAAIGFGITRFVVAGTIDGPAGAPFAVAVVSMTVGLAFTIYGVVLAVGDFPRSYVVTVVRWTVLGVSLMVGVLALTVLGMAGGGGFAAPGGSRLLVANALLGGAVGGALTGDRAGLNRRQREEIELQAELGRVVNGLLRHEVLNATAVIDGYASLFDEEAPRESDVAAIRAATDRIEATVSDVGAVGRARGADSVTAVDLLPVLREELAAFRERYPEGDVSLSAPEGEVGVVADGRLRLLVGSFLSTAAARSESPSVEVGVSVDRHRVGLRADSAAVSPSDAGGAGDPAAGFDRRVLELLADHYGGDVLADPAGGTLTLELPRATGDATGGRFGITPAGVGAAVVAGALAGVLMGVLSQQFAGLLPVIGSLYGTFDPLVGWITHLFHSVVFAVVFAAGCAHLGPRVRGDADAAAAALGLAWGLLLWFVAAGFVMPVWLRLTGGSVAVPNLTAVGLLTHAAWGLTVGVLYPRLGDRFAADVRLEWLRAVVGRRFGDAFG